MLAGIGEMFNFKLKNRKYQDPKKTPVLTFAGVRKLEKNSQLFLKKNEFFQIIIY